MNRRAQIARLPDGRLHVQDGPIDLILRADGEAAARHAAHEAAIARFYDVLDELCRELPLLRAAAQPASDQFQSPVARAMNDACAPLANFGFITPMAAVAGAVADDILQTMAQAALLERAFVNNGGDIALHLAPGQNFTAGLVARVDAPAIDGVARIEARHPVRGIATSGWRGRSFSLGIADAVTVLAASAAAADAAATVIANAVDLPGHSAVTRLRACDIQPDSDLRDRPVTRAVGALAASDIDEALAKGEARARLLLDRGAIAAAWLHLQGATRTVQNVALCLDRPTSATIEEIGPRR